MVETPKINNFAIDYGVPHHGGEAWSEGWDITANPYDNEPFKKRWADLWRLANDQAYDEYMTEHVNRG